MSTTKLTQQSCVAYSRRPQFFSLTFGFLAVICLFFSLAGQAHASGFGLQSLEVSAIIKNDTLISKLARTRTSS